jgi:hypothetical protein
MENQSLINMNAKHQSEVQLETGSDYNDMFDTNTEVSLVTGVDYGGGQESISSPNGIDGNDGSTMVLKGVLWTQRDKVFSRWKERYFVLTTDYLQCFKKASPSVMHSAASEMGRFIFKLKLTEVRNCRCPKSHRVQTLKCSSAWGHHHATTKIARLETGDMAQKATNLKYMQVTSLRNILATNLKN